MSRGAVSSLTHKGDPQAIVSAILRLAVITPAILHVFWMPGDAIDGLIRAFSPRTEEEKPLSA